MLAHSNANYGTRHRQLNPIIVQDVANMGLITKIVFEDSLKWDSP